MKYKQAIKLAQNKQTKRMLMHLKNKSYSFLKKQLVPTNVNFAMVFMCKLFQSSLQVGCLKSYSVTNGLVDVKTIAVVIMRV